MRLPTGCPNVSESHAIAFVGSRLRSWDGYQLANGYHGGEAYWAAAIDYALAHVLGYEVDHYDEKLTDLYNSSVRWAAWAASLPQSRNASATLAYHRLLFDSKAALRLTALAGASAPLHCSARILEWMPWRSSDVPPLSSNVFAPWVWTSARWNPHLPFFPHSTVT